LHGRIQSPLFGIDFQQVDISHEIYTREVGPKGLVHHQKGLSVRVFHLAQARALLRVVPGYMDGGGYHKAHPQAHIP
jgi:hypothetical protein